MQAPVRRENLINEIISKSNTDCPKENENISCSICCLSFEKSIYTNIQLKTSIVDAVITIKIEADFFIVLYFLRDTSKSKNNNLHYDST